ncbi:MAG: UvrD-helicase domain-containing protein, partial [Alphaproteobacteria bacterium]|nr:UvrD-helicase domain-containing protein [Alphaproteobacteria bacterium]
MLFYADMHIHSKYSRATSKDCDLEGLAMWAQKKGLSVISTGDFTHPAWFNEIKEKLTPTGNGVFSLKDSSSPVKFLLSVEISTIYKQGDKTRKVHHVVFVPDFESAERLRQKLSAVGNIRSDGRPILGLNSRDLLEITLEAGEGSFIIPAHIWTPWFSVLGSKSGFDCIEDCYADLAGHIFALETGLSADPEMIWRVSSLDKYRLVSNSDAHSPSKLAREATIFDTEPDYFSILKALKTGEGYTGTVEFFPEEGKYHEDGHRKCNIHLSPEETVKLNGICPVCNKPLTIGVLHRVNELADRKEEIIPPSTAGKVVSLVPLQEILSEIMGVRASSKSVVHEYEKLIQKLGPELSILTNVPAEEISKVHSSILAEGILRLRKGKVIKQPGFDGEYGVIRLFEPNEIKMNFSFDLGMPVEASAAKALPAASPVPIVKALPQRTADAPQGLDEHQLKAVENKARQLLIVAGPGSGKTTVLTQRIAYQVKQKNIPPENCLAITFTRKAAQEMRSRLNLPGINIHTFHSLCYAILKENSSDDFTVAAEPGEGIITFDDLIIITVKFLEDNPGIAKSYQERFKYISVDEYQDIDENQYKLIRLLAPPDGNLCAIGDPNQAIYGFRGGDAKFFNNFTQDYTGAQIINLKNNYRSTGTIVNASNQMINSYNITSKYDKPHEKIFIHTAPTDKAEAEFIVSTIENLIGGHSFFSIDSERSSGEESNFSFSDFAVLYRTSTQLPPLIEALKRSGMPFVKLSNDLLCEKKPIRNLLNRLSDAEPMIEQLNRLSLEFSDEIEDYILKYLVELAQTHSTKDEFIPAASLLTEIDTLDKRADRISLLTLHSSKGLEFKCV